MEESLSRLPPHHLEAERSVLGAILVNNQNFENVRDQGLEARDFYQDAHQKIYETVCALAEQRQAIDLITLTTALKDRNYLDAIGGTRALTQLFEDRFAASNAVNYAKIVREKAIRRRMINACSDIINDSFEGSKNLDEFLDESEKAIMTVADTRMSAAFAPIRSVLLDNLQQIETLALHKKEISGLATGFRDFDRLTTGLHPGQVMIVAARPGMGKTSWFLSAIQHVVSDPQSVAAIFSLEMTKEELSFRLLSGQAMLDSKALRLGRLSERDWRKLMDSMDRLSKARIFMDDSGGLTVMDIRSRCRRLLSTERRLDLIVVDYLQLMRGSKSAKNADNREREISEISRGLKELAKELRVPVIALSQLSRAVEGRTDKRPMLSDLRESGSIEQDADLVTFIYRDDYYNKDSEDRGIAELIVAKNRSGPTDTVRLKWFGEYTKFENLDHDSPGTPITPYREMN